MELTALNINYTLCVLNKLIDVPKVMHKIETSMNKTAYFITAFLK